MSKLETNEADIEISEKQNDGTCILWAGNDFSYINKSDAEQIINHLKEQFEL